MRHYCVGHRRGVAGGGWEDEETDETDAVVNVPRVDLSLSGNSVSMENDRFRSFHASELMNFVERIV